MLKKFFTLLLTLLFILPLTVNAKSQSVQIDGDHGKLSAVIQTPDGKASYPLVMILHGFTGNKNEPLLTTLADNLEKAGIASIRFDFNGHGESEGNFSDMTVLNEIEDAKKVYNYVSKLQGVTSVSIAGHSQGGVVTSMVAGELGTKKVKCIALMAPAAVLRDDGLHPVAFAVDILFIRILVPEFQLGACDGYVDDAYPDVLRQVFDHLATEEIDRAQVVAFPADGWRGRVPMALLPSIAGHVDRRHELEARVVEALVLRRRPGAGLHVGLSETEIDVEIGVGPLGVGLQAQRQGDQDRDETLEHIDVDELANGFSSHKNTDIMAKKQPAQRRRGFAGEIYSYYL